MKQIDRQQLEKTMTHDLSKLNNDEIFFQILMAVEEVNSFCPECVIHSGTHLLFSEAYRRFYSWDAIVDKCIEFSNSHSFYKFRLMPSSEILLEMLKLENQKVSLDETDIMKNYPELHRMAVMMYGSWHCVLKASGIEIKIKRKRGKKTKQR
jgi:hypothetical protein